MKFTMKLILWIVLVTFFTTTVAPSTVHADVAFLPPPGKMVSLTPAFNPPIVRGIKVFKNNPFKFDFIVDTGDEKYAAKGVELKQVGKKLITYFLASLTIPEKDMWVNLSPYENERIIAPDFGNTDMGKELLAQDYILKQVTATLMYPEGNTGAEFWKKIYTESIKRFGTINIVVNTLNKVWIVPERASVYENPKDNTVVIVDSRLKVMLEDDYLALTKQKINVQEANQQMSNEIIRQIIVPQLEKEVNEGKNFATLRQVYNSLILATWYKNNLKRSILSQGYVDRAKISGFEVEDKDITQKIYEQYLKSYRKGVYNYIKEDVDPATNTTTAKKHFAGGVELKDLGMTVQAQILRGPDAAQVARKTLGNTAKMLILSFGLAAAFSSNLSDATVPPAPTVTQQGLAVNQGKKLTFSEHRKKMEAKKAFEAAVQKAVKEATGENSPQEAVEVTVKDKDTAFNLVKNSKAAKALADEKGEFTWAKFQQAFKSGKIRIEGLDGRPITDPNKISAGYKVIINLSGAEATQAPVASAATPSPDNAKAKVNAPNVGKPIVKAPGKKIDEQAKVAATQEQIKQEMTQRQIALEEEEKRLQELREARAKQIEDANFEDNRQGEINEGVAALFGHLAYRPMSEEEERKKLEELLSARDWKGLKAYLTITRGSGGSNASPFAAHLGKFNLIPTLDSEYAKFAETWAIANANKITIQGGLVFVNNLMNMYNNYKTNAGNPSAGRIVLTDKLPERFFVDTKSVVNQAYFDQKKNEWVQLSEDKLRTIFAAEMLETFKAGAALKILKPLGLDEAAFGKLVNGQYSGGIGSFFFGDPNKEMPILTEPGVYQEYGIGRILHNQLAFFKTKENSNWTFVTIRERMDPNAITDPKFDKYKHRMVRERGVMFNDKGEAYQTFDEIVYVSEKEDPNFILPTETQVSVNASGLDLIQAANGRAIMKGTNHLGQKISGGGINPITFKVGETYPLGQTPVTVRDYVQTVAGTWTWGDFTFETTGRFSDGTQNLNAFVYSPEAIKDSLSFHGAPKEGVIWSSSDLLTSFSLDKGYDSVVLLKQEKLEKPLRVSFLSKSIFNNSKGNPILYNTDQSKHSKYGRDELGVIYGALPEEHKDVDIIIAGGYEGNIVFINQDGKKVVMLGVSTFRAIAKYFKGDKKQPFLPIELKERQLDDELSNILKANTSIVLPKGQIVYRQGNKIGLAYKLDRQVHMQAYENSLSRNIYSTDEAEDLSKAGRSLKPGETLTSEYSFAGENFKHVVKTAVRAGIPAPVVVEKGFGLEEGKHFIVLGFGKDYKSSLADDGKSLVRIIDPKTGKVTKETYMPVLKQAFGVAERFTYGPTRQQIDEIQKIQRQEQAKLEETVDKYQRAVLEYQAAMNFKRAVQEAQQGINIANNKALNTFLEAHAQSRVLTDASLALLNFAAEIAVKQALDHKVASADEYYAQFLKEAQTDVRAAVARLIKDFEEASKNIRDPFSKDDLGKLKETIAEIIANIEKYKNYPDNLPTVPAANMIQVTQADLVANGTTFLQSQANQNDTQSRIDGVEKGLKTTTANRVIGFPTNVVANDDDELSANQKIIDQMRTLKEAVQNQRDRVSAFAFIGMPDTSVIDLEKKTAISEANHTAKKEKLDAIDQDTTTISGFESYQIPTNGLISALEVQAKTLAGGKIFDTNLAIIDNPSITMAQALQYTTTTQQDANRQAAIALQGKNEWASRDVSYIYLFDDYFKAIVDRDRLFASQGALTDAIAYWENEQRKAKEQLPSNHEIFAFYSRLIKNLYFERDTYLPKAIEAKNYDVRNYLYPGTVKKAKFTSAHPQGLAILNKLVEKRVIDYQSSTDLRILISLDGKEKEIRAIIAEIDNSDATFKTFWSLLQESRPESAEKLLRQEALKIKQEVANLYAQLKQETASIINDAFTSPGRLVDYKIAAENLYPSNDPKSPVGDQISEGRKDLKARLARIGSGPDGQLAKLQKRLEDYRNVYQGNDIIRATQLFIEAVPLESAWALAQLESYDLDETALNAKPGDKKEDPRTAILRHKKTNALKQLFDDKIVEALTILSKVRITNYKLLAENLYPSNDPNSPVGDQISKGREYINKRLKEITDPLTGSLADSQKKIDLLMIILPGDPIIAKYQKIMAYDREEVALLNKQLTDLLADERALNAGGKFVETPRTAIARDEEITRLQWELDLKRLALAKELSTMTVADFSKTGKNMYPSPKQLDEFESAINVDDKEIDQLTGLPLPTMGSLARALDGVAKLTVMLEKLRKVYSDKNFIAGMELLIQYNREKADYNRQALIEFKKDREGLATPEGKVFETQDKYYERKQKLAELKQKYLKTRALADKLLDGLVLADYTEAGTNLYLTQEQRDAGRIYFNKKDNAKDKKTGAPLPEMGRKQRIQDPQKSDVGELPGLRRMYQLMSRIFPNHPFLEVLSLLIQALEVEQQWIAASEAWFDAEEKALANPNNDEDVLVALKRKLAVNKLKTQMDGLRNTALTKLFANNMQITDYTDAVPVEKLEKIPQMLKDLQERLDAGIPKAKGYIQQIIDNPEIPAKYKPDLKGLLQTLDEEAAWILAYAIPNLKKDLEYHAKGKANDPTIETPRQVKERKDPEWQIRLGFLQKRAEHHEPLTELTSQLLKKNDAYTKYLVDQVKKSLEHVSARLDGPANPQRRMAGALGELGKSLIAQSGQNQKMAEAAKKTGDLLNKVQAAALDVQAAYKKAGDGYVPTLPISSFQLMTPEGKIIDMMSLNGQKPQDFFEMMLKQHNLKDVQFAVNQIFGNSTAYVGTLQAEHINQRYGIWSVTLTKEQASLVDQFFAGVIKESEFRQRFESAGVGEERTILIVGNATGYTNGNMSISAVAVITKEVETNASVKGASTGAFHISFLNKLGTLGEKGPQMSLNIEASGARSTGKSLSNVVIKDIYTGSTITSYTRLLEAANGFANVRVGLESSGISVGDASVKFGVFVNDEHLEYFGGKKSNRFVTVNTDVSFGGMTMKLEAGKNRYSVGFADTKNFNVTYNNINGKGSLQAQYGFDKYGQRVNLTGGVDSTGKSLQISVNRKLDNGDSIEAGVGNQGPSLRYGMQLTQGQSLPAINPNDPKYSATNAFKQGFDKLPKGPVSPDLKKRLRIPDSYVVPKRADITTKIPKPQPAKYLTTLDGKIVDFLPAATIAELAAVDGSGNDIVLRRLDGPVAQGKPMSFFEKEVKALVDIPYFFKGDKNLWAKWKNWLQEKDGHIYLLIPGFEEPLDLKDGKIMLIHPDDLAKLGIKPEAGRPLAPAIVEFTVEGKKKALDAFLKEADTYRTLARDTQQDALKRYDDLPDTAPVRYALKINAKGDIWKALWTKAEHEAWLKAGMPRRHLTVTVGKHAGLQPYFIDKNGNGRMDADEEQSLEFFSSPPKGYSALESDIVFVGNQEAAPSLIEDGANIETPMAQARRGQHLETQFLVVIEEPGKAAKPVFMPRANALAYLQAHPGNKTKVMQINKDGDTVGRVSLSSKTPGVFEIEVVNPKNPTRTEIRELNKQGAVARGSFVAYTTIERSIKVGNKYYNEVVRRDKDGNFEQGTLMDEKGKTFGRVYLDVDADKSRIEIFDGDPTATQYTSKIYEYEDYLAGKTTDPIIITEASPDPETGLTKVVSRIQGKVNQDAIVIDYFKPGPIIKSLQVASERFLQEEKIYFKDGQPQYAVSMNTTKDPGVTLIIDGEKVSHVTGIYQYDENGNEGLFVDLREVDRNPGFLKFRNTKTEKGKVMEDQYGFFAISAALSNFPEGTTDKDLFKSAQHGKTYQQKEQYVRDATRKLMHLQTSIYAETQWKPSEKIVEGQIGLQSKWVSQLRQQGLIADTFNQFGISEETVFIETIRENIQGVKVKEYRVKGDVSKRIFFSILEEGGQIMLVNAGLSFDPANGQVLVSLELTNDLQARAIWKIQKDQDDLRNSIMSRVRNLETIYAQTGKKHLGEEVNWAVDLRKQGMSERTRLVKAIEIPFIVLSSDSDKNAYKEIEPEVRRLMAAYDKAPDEQVKADILNQIEDIVVRFNRGKAKYSNIQGNPIVHYRQNVSTPTIATLKEEDGTSGKQGTWTIRYTAKAGQTLFVINGEKRIVTLPPTEAPCSIVLAVDNGIGTLQQTLLFEKTGTMTVRHNGQPVSVQFNSFHVKDNLLYSRFIYTASGRAISLEGGYVRNWIMNEWPQIRGNETVNFAPFEASSTPTYATLDEDGRITQVVLNQNFDYNHNNYYQQVSLTTIEQSPTAPQHLAPRSKPTVHVQLIEDGKPVKGTKDQIDRRTQIIENIKEKWDILLYYPAALLGVFGVGGIIRNIKTKRIKKSNKEKIEEAEHRPYDIAIHEVVSPSWKGYGYTADDVETARQFFQGSIWPKMRRGEDIKTILEDESEAYSVWLKTVLKREGYEPTVEDLWIAVLVYINGGISRGLPDVLAHTTFRALQLKEQGRGDSIASQIAIETNLFEKILYLGQSIFQGRPGGLPGEDGRLILPSQFFINAYDVNDLFRTPEFVEWYESLGEARVAIYQDFIKQLEPLAKNLHKALVGLKKKHGDVSVKFRSRDVVKLEEYQRYIRFFKEFNDGKFQLSDEFTSPHITRQEAQGKIDGKPLVKKTSSDVSTPLGSRFTLPFRMLNAVAQVVKTNFGEIFKVTAFSSAAIFTMAAVNGYITAPVALGYLAATVTGLFGVKYLLGKFLNRYVNEKAFGKPLPLSAGYQKAKDPKANVWYRRLFAPLFYGGTVALYALIAHYTLIPHSQLVGASTVIPFLGTLNLNFLMMMSLWSTPIFLFIFTTWIMDYMLTPKSTHIDGALQGVNIVQSIEDIEKLQEDSVLDDLVDISLLPNRGAGLTAQEKRAKRQMALNHAFSRLRAMDEIDDLEEEMARNGQYNHFLRENVREEVIFFFNSLAMEQPDRPHVNRQRTMTRMIPQVDEENMLPFNENIIRGEVTREDFIKADPVSGAKNYDKLVADGILVENEGKARLRGNATDPFKRPKALQRLIYNGVWNMLYTSQNPNALNAVQKSGYTNLNHIIWKDPIRWKNFIERIQKRKNSKGESLATDVEIKRMKRLTTGRGGLGTVSNELEMEIRFWASLQTQTMVQSLEGAMEEARTKQLYYMMDLGYDKRQAQEATRENHQIIWAYQVWGDVLKKPLSDLNSQQKIRDTVYLLKKYWEEDGFLVQLASLQQREGLWYRVLSQYNPETGKVEDLPPKLLGDVHPLYVEGKAANLLHASSFAWGEVVSNWDMNMGLSPLEALKSTKVNELFANKQVASVNYPEHITSKNQSKSAYSVGMPEGVFNEDYKGAMYRKAHLLNHGHPDHHSHSLLRQQGGMGELVSIPEDLLGSIIRLVRGKQTEQIRWYRAKKAKDNVFSAIMGFYTKVSSGTAQALSHRFYEEVYKRFGSFQNTMFFQSSAPFYLKDAIAALFVISYAFNVMLMGVSPFVAFGTDIIHAIFGNFILGQAIVGLAYSHLVLKQGFKEATKVMIKTLPFMAPIYIALLFGTQTGLFFGLLGISLYVATGRGLGLEPQRMDVMIKQYTMPFMVPGAIILGLSLGSIDIWRNWTLLNSVLTMLVGPILMMTPYLTRPTTLPNKNSTFANSAKLNKEDFIDFYDAVGINLKARFRANEPITGVVLATMSLLHLIPLTVIAMIVQPLAVVEKILKLKFRGPALPPQPPHTNVRQQDGQPDLKVHENVSNDSNFVPLKTKRTASMAMAVSNSLWYPFISKQSLRMGNMRNPGGINVGILKVDVQNKNAVKTAFSDKDSLRLLLDADGLIPVIYEIKPMSVAMVDLFVGAQ